MKLIIPKISYCNFRKRYPNMGDCFKRWFMIQRYWSGQIINISIKHHVFGLDFRNYVII